MTKSQQFIQKYKKVLETGPDFFARDSALMKPEEFEKRKYKFLLIAPSPALTKSVSATMAVINDMFCSEMPDWFFDVAYLPTKKDLELYDKNNVPYCIGQVSHLDASHFTVVGFTISVLHEILTAPAILKSFQRCDKPIPLTWTERKDTLWGTHPLIIAGGITAAHGEVMFGELGDGREAYLDFLTLGICDTLKMMAETIDQEAKPTMTNQEVIETLFKHEFIYQPQAYKVVFKDNLIVENTKINPKARDFVKPYYPKFIPPRLGVGRTIIQPTGTNAGDTQIQLSEGALVEGTLIATQRGLVPIEQVTTEDSAWSIKGLYPVIQTWSLGEMECVKLITKKGKELVATRNHPIYQWNPVTGEDFVPAGRLQVSDCLVSVPYDEVATPSDTLSDYLDEIVAIESLTAKVYDLTVFNSHRYNANSIEVHNCTGGRGNCYFSVAGDQTIITDQGVMRIEDAFKVQKNLKKVRGEKTLEKFEMIAKTGFEEVWFVRTMNHQTLKCSAEHKWVHIVDGELVECLTKDLQRGMRIYTFVNGEYVPTAVAAVRNTGTKAWMYDVVNTETHLCVYNNILTHQCAESNYSGSWQEATLDQVKKHALETKRWSAATSCKPMSFNQISADTIIPVQGGFRRAWAVREDDKLLSLSGSGTHKGKIAGSEGEEWLELKLSMGPSARMSKDHRQVVFTEEGETWKYARELSKGDVFITKTGYHGQAPEFKFNELAYLAGVWFAADPLRIRYHKPCIKAKRSLSLILDRFTDVTRCSNSSRGVYYQASKTLEDYLNSRFVAFDVDADYLVNFPVEEALSFIRGWFTVKGTVTGSLETKIYLTATETDLSILEWASVVLNSVGIQNRISKPMLKRLPGRGAEVTFYDLYVQTQESKRLCKEWLIRTVQDYPAEKISEHYIGDANVELPKVVREYAKNNSEKLQDLLDDGWRFVEVEGIEEIPEMEGIDILESDDHMYLTGFGLTHNCNHVKDFTEVIYALNEAFPKVTYINMRLEELAQDPEVFKLMRYTGASRLSAPIEGLSNRIRNGFMNKNLSIESIEKLLRFMIGQRVTDIKVGLVWSGFENEEDWKEMRSLVAKLKAEAASLNRKLPFRLKCTPLVYYPGTPLEVAERVTSRISYNGERYFNDEMYEKNKEVDIHIKINGFRGSTFIEQALVDLGGSLTAWVQQHIVSPGVVCYNTRPVSTEENFPSFKALIIAPEKYFAARHLDSYISPFHRIRLDLEGGIIEGQRRLENNPFEEEPTGKCLFTFEGCKTKCFHNIMKKRPFKHYYDVKLIDGHLQGEQYDLIEGCNSCESPQEMKEQHLQREWAHKFSVDDLQAQVVTRSQMKYRLVLKRPEEYSLVSPHSTAFTTVACLLRQSQRLLESYWDLTDHSLATQMGPELVYDIQGYQVVDLIFKEEVLDELKRVIPQANEELRTAKICSVQEIPLHEKLRTDDVNIYKFELQGVSLETLINGKATYRGGVRVLSNVDMQPKVVSQVDKDLVYPLFKRKGNKIIGYFALPRKYNPYLFFQEVLSEKKYTQKQIQQMATFEVVSVLQKDSYTHCKCGRTTVRSAITGKAIGRCEQCSVKALFSKL